MPFIESVPSTEYMATNSSATLVAVASQAAGIDLLVAGQTWLEGALGRHLL